MLLHARADAHAEHAACGDGIDALAGLPQHTGGIQRRKAPGTVHTARSVAFPAGQPLQEVRADYYTRRNEQQQPAAGREGADEHRGKNQAEQDHAGVMRLLVQQIQDEQQRQRRLYRAVPQPILLVIVAVQHICRPEHEREFCQLRRLEGGTARQIHPAVGAVGVLRAEQRQDQQHNGDDVQTLTHQTQRAVVDVGQDPHKEQPYNCNHDLRFNDTVQFTAGGVGAGIAGREQHRQPEEQNDQQQGEKAPGDRPPLQLGQAYDGYHAHNISDGMVKQKAQQCTHNAHGSAHGRSPPLGAETGRGRVGPAPLLMPHRCKKFPLPHR